MTNPTSTQTLDYSVRVYCDCRTCKTNAVKIGATFPLAAMMNTTAAANLDVKDGDTDHDTVHLAHDPIFGKFQSVAKAV